MALEFLKFLSQIPDPCRAQGRKWQLGPMLLATILAVLSGAASYRKVHSFIETHRQRPIRAFGFKLEEGGGVQRHSQHPARARSG